MIRVRYKKKKKFLTLKFKIKINFAANFILYSYLYQVEDVS